MVHGADSRMPGRVGARAVRVPSYLVQDHAHAASEAGQGLGPNQTSYHVRQTFLIKSVGASHALAAIFCCGSVAAEA